MFTTILRRLTLLVLLVTGMSAAVLSQGRVSQRPYILELSGACSPGEMSVDYFIGGGFGGYSSYIKTDSRFPRYEVPTVRDGVPARSLKLMARGARCRTQIIDIPELEPDGRVIRVRLRRSRQLEFRGRIANVDQLPRRNTLLTVEYWAHWKCEFMGVPDCMIGPNRIDVADIKSEGRFKVRLPDLANDPALGRFAVKGDFQIFIRDRDSGNILFDLRHQSPAGATRTVPVTAGPYSEEMVFTLMPRE